MCPWLLHSPSLVAVELSVGYETWPTFGWHHLFVIGGWSKYRLGLPSAHCIMGSHEQWELPPYIRPKWQSLCMALTAGKCLPLGPCKGTVKESMCPDIAQLVMWYTISPLTWYSHMYDEIIQGCCVDENMSIIKMLVLNYWMKYLFTSWITLREHKIYWHFLLIFNKMATKASGRIHYPNIWCLICLGI